MLGDALRKYTGLRHQLDENLIGENGAEWEAQLKLFLKKRPTWVKAESTKVPETEVSHSIIEWNSDLVIPAQPQFVVADHFTKENKVVKFWYFGDNFQAMFMPMIEKEVDEVTTRIGKLRVQAKLADMTSELGENRVMASSQLYWMLSQQPQGEKPNSKNRRLLTNGCSNILRVLDKDGIERAVYAGWDESHGWGIGAVDLGYDGEWDAGGQVVSRK